MRNMSSWSKRYDLFVIALSVIIIAGSILYLSHSETRTVTGNGAGEARVTPSSSAPAIRTTRAEAPLQSDSNAPIRKPVVSEFREILLRRDEIGHRLGLAKNRILEANPRITALRNYAFAQVKAVAGPHPELVSELKQFELSQGESARRMRNASSRFHSPIVLLDAISSKERIGDTTLGAIVNELSETPSFQRNIESALNGIAADYGIVADYVSTGPAENNESATDRSKSILRRLDGYKSICEGMYQQILAKEIEDPDLRRFAAELDYGHQLVAIAQAYKDVQFANLAPLEKEVQKLGGKLVLLQDSVPITSAENSQMAELLIDAALLRTQRQ